MTVKAKGGLARLFPKTSLGLRLTIGALVLVLSAWMLGGIAEDVVTGAPLTVVDAQLATWFDHHTAPNLTRAMRLISLLGSAPVIATLSAGAAAVFVKRQRWQSLSALGLTVGGGALLNVLLKHAFHRARPQFAHPLEVLTSYSFPSGHAMASTTFYGLFAVWAVVGLESWRWRTAVVLAAVALVLVIGFSRLYLGAHYLSDVLAGISAGVTWLAFCLTGLETARHHRHRGDGDRREDHATG